MGGQNAGESQTLPGIAGPAAMEKTRDVTGIDAAGSRVLPADRSLAGEDRLVRFAIILTLGLTALRLAVSGSFDLFFDEAYYWVWSQQLAPGYYDHPPMVAFFIRAGTLLFGDTEFGVRFFGILAGAADAFLVFAIMRTLSGSRRVGAWAMILMDVTTISAFSVMIVPDQPMMLFWLAGLFGLAKIARGGAPSWWLFVGLMGGLAAVSKLTTLFLALAVPLWLLAVPSLRPWFRRPWVYAAAAIAFLTFLPVLLWNMENDWAAFSLQYNRPQFPEPSLGSFLQYLSLWPLMIGPVVIVLAAVGLRAAFRGGAARRDPAMALLVFSPVPLAIYLGWHSLGEWIGAHWVAPIAAIGAMLAAIGIDDLRRRKGFWAGVVAFCRRAAVPVGIFVTVVFYALILERTLPLPRAYDVMERFRGWDEFAAEVEAARAEADAEYILAADYSQYALLRFYSAPGAPIFPLGDRDRWDHFGDLAVIGPDGAAMRGLYIGKWSQDEARQVLSGYFASYDLVRAVDRPLRPNAIDRKWSFLVEEPLPAAMPLFRPRDDIP